MSAIKKSSVFAVMFLVMFAGSARAQEMIAAKVPFPFAVGSKLFPAGRYDIRVGGDSHGVMSIRGRDNNSASFAMTTSAEGGDPAGDQPVLLFKRYENGYRLSQIWDSSTEGRELSRLSDRRRTARAAAPAGLPEEAQVGLSEESTYLVQASIVATR